jgi:hypothetical protein
MFNTMEKTKSRDRNVPKLAFRDAAVVLTKLGVRNSSHFEELKRQNRIPFEIPTRPDMFYKNEWESWQDFLVLGKELAENDFIPTKTSYKDLKATLRRLGISQKDDYIKALSDGRLSENTTKTPDVTYGDEWEGWQAFLAEDLKYVSFSEAKRFAERLKLKSAIEWRIYCREGKRPAFIPALPDRTYEEFTTWQNFLGIDTH